MILDEKDFFWMDFIWSAMDYFSFALGVITVLLVELLLNRINRFFND